MQQLKTPARFLSTTLILLLMASWSVAWAGEPVKSSASQQAVLQWINSYRAKPEPERLAEVVKALHKLGLLRDLETAGVYIGFTAGVLGTNPHKARHLIAGMFPMPPESQVIIIRAIAYSGLPDWKDLLRDFSERMPVREVLIRRLLDGKLPTLERLQLQSSPAALDTNWGYYFASGSPAPVKRIIDALAWVKEGNDLDRLTAGNMAKWTLANNAMQDKDLIDLLKADLTRRSGGVRTELADVIEAAETFETARIRKQAQAAIEDLRVKGPASRRQMSFWSQAGQTALALGCVVAGALGHPEVAVPCVIGGAATSAAIKVLTPQ
ncbi:MAG: hypothetical protein R3D67_14165 [Hyphomicrobiaceae bacterium]